MSHTLKLSIYCFSIHKSHAKNFVSFREYFHNHFLENDENQQNVDINLLYERFAKKLIDPLSNEFKKNQEETKAIAIEQFNIIQNKSIIDGFMKGGLTGIDQEIYKTANTQQPSGEIHKEEIASLPYYYKIWLPFDSSLGVIMIQSYTETSIASLFLNNFKNHFQSQGYIFCGERHVPTEYKEKFRKRSIIKEVTLYKNKLSKEARTALNTLFTDCEGLKISIKISNIKINIDSFEQGLKKGHFINTDLSALEIGDQQNYDILAKYEDTHGRESQVKLSKNLDIFPTIILDSSLKEYGKEYPDYQKIQNHTDMILDHIKKEIDYSPEDVD